MVDRMEEEKGEDDGPIPTIFVGLDAEVLRRKLVGYTDASGDARHFGAGQVILVRDGEMKEKLKKDFDGIGLVLSILDSKGMEFDVVYLVDFFTSSPTLPDIRKLKNILSRDDYEDGSKKAENSPLLCSELKVYNALVPGPFLFGASHGPRPSADGLVSVTGPEHFCLTICLLVDNNVFFFNSISTWQ